MEKSKILWIEDESFRQKYILSDLDKNLFHIDFAKTVKEALYKIENDSFDLIILDLILPKGIDYTEEEYKSGSLRFEDYEGFEILDFLIEKKIFIPINIITIINQNHIYEKIKTYLNNPLINIKGMLSKGILKPEEVKDLVYQTLNLV